MKILDSCPPAGRFGMAIIVSWSSRLQLCSERYRRHVSGLKSAYFQHCLWRSYQRFKQRRAKSEVFSSLWLVTYNYLLLVFIQRDVLFFFSNIHVLSWQHFSVSQLAVLWGVSNTAVSSIWLTHKSNNIFHWMCEYAVFSAIANRKSPKSSSSQKSLFQMSVHGLFLVSSTSHYCLRT